MELVKVIANIISTLTIFTCLFSKVPQIKHLKERKRAEGMNIQAMLMEVIGFSIVILYNFTNSYSVLTYLEYPIILFQIYVMLFYTLQYKNLIGEPVVTFLTTAYFSVVVGFVIGVLPKVLLPYLMPFVTPINGMAKVSYMYGIIKERNASSVSATTWVISVLTNLSCACITVVVHYCFPPLTLDLKMLPETKLEFREAIEDDGGLRSEDYSQLYNHKIILPISMLTLCTENNFA